MCTIDTEDGDAHLRSTGEEGESLLWNAVEHTLLERGRTPDERITELLSAHGVAPGSLRTEGSAAIPWTQLNWPSWRPDSPSMPRISPSREIL